MPRPCYDVAMHLPTHALASWLVAESGPARTARRERILVLCAGLIPDLDALSLLGGVEAYQRWHRIVLHNALAAFACALLFGSIARPGLRLATGLLALVGYHLHLLCDLVGSAGPDGSNWPIPYFVPFSHRPIEFSGQWGLASWQNVSFTVALLIASWALAVRRGRTVIEALSPRADAAVVEVAKRRWPLSAPLR